MRVLLLNWRDIKHPAGGGAEVWAHRVAEGLVELGHTVTFHTAAVEGEPKREAINGVEVVRAGSRLGVYGAAKKFYKAHSTDFDVILEEINTKPFFAHRWGKTPTVPMIHQVAREIWQFEAPLPVALIGRFVLEPMWLRRFQHRHVMTLSPSSAESLREYGISDLSIVLPGSDDNEVKYRPKSAVPVVCFLGRLVKSKRPDHAVAAFRILRETFPDAELWIMGAGPMADRLKGEASEGVRLLGHVSSAEREERLASAHVLVTTTVREGWGLNVSEAAALGTPTIGYNAPGLVDSISMSGGITVDQDPENLGRALTAFFCGELKLQPRIATQSWSDVCRQIEGELQTAIRRLES